MRYFLFASHGRMAEGVLGAVELILGKQDHIWTINAYIDDHKDFKEEVSKMMTQISLEDELIVVTDIFGGSVNNEFMNLLNDKRIHLVTGLNLPLVIELLTKNEQEEDTIQWIQSTVRYSKSFIQYCNELDRDAEDDDF